MISEGIEKRLNHLRRLGGNQLLDDLINLFFCTGPERLKGLGEALAQGKLAEVARLAHSLTSSAGNLGATELQDLAARLEHQAGAGETTSLQDLVRQLEESWERTRPLLLAHKKKGEG
jgi:HPt (histidine-containing phosphotransfer) domain-containing protein